MSAQHSTEHAHIVTRHFGDDFQQTTEVIVFTDAALDGEIRDVDNWAVEVETPLAVGLYAVNVVISVPGEDQFITATLDRAGAQCLRDRLDAWLAYSA